MRKYKRQIARAFMADAGVGNVNRKMGAFTKNGVKVWREALKEHAKWCRRNDEMNVRKKTKRMIRKAAEA